MPCYQVTFVQDIVRRHCPTWNVTTHSRVAMSSQPHRLTSLSSREAIAAACPTWDEFKRQRTALGEEGIRRKGVVPNNYVLIYEAFRSHCNSIRTKRSVDYRDEWPIYLEESLRRTREVRSESPYPIPSSVAPPLPLTDPTFSSLSQPVPPNHPPFFSPSPSPSIRYSQPLSESTRASAIVVTPPLPLSSSSSSHPPPPLSLPSSSGRKRKSPSLEAEVQRLSEAVESIESELRSIKQKLAISPSDDFQFSPPASTPPSSSSSSSLAPTPPQ
jgi:hypothetical protein